MVGGTHVSGENRRWNGTAVTMEKTLVQRKPAIYPDLGTSDGSDPLNKKVTKSTKDGPGDRQWITG